MRTVSVSTLLAFSLGVQHAAATGWTDAKVYKNPSNTNNQCIGEQSNGLSFDDRSNGDLGDYGALNWQNLKCTDGLRKRTFSSNNKSPKGFAGGKCASGTASKNVDTSPKFSCGSNQKGMSIDHIHVSTSEDTDIELHYGYENGDVCKQTSPCNSAGKIIENFQCGGAKSVTVKLPDTDQKANCEVGIHSIGFNCGPASSKPSVPSSTSIESTPIVSTSQETKPYPYPTANTTTLVGSTAPSSIPESTSVLSTSTAGLPIPSTTFVTPTTSVYFSTSSSSSPVESIPTTNSVPSTPVYDNTSTTATSPVETVPTSSSISSSSPVETIPTTALVPSTPIYDTTSTSATGPVETVPTSSSISLSSLVETLPTISSIPTTSPVETFPATTAPGTTVPVVTTEVVISTLTTCPVTNTITSGSSTSLETTSTISTVFITSTSTVCTYCVPPPASTVESTTVPIGTTAVPTETSIVPLETFTTHNSPETPSSLVPVSSSSSSSPVPPEISTTQNSPETSGSLVPVPSSSTPSPLPTTTQAVVTTEVIHTFLTTCPITSTITSGGTTSFLTITTVSTITSTSTSTICTQCVPPAETIVPPPAVTTPIPSSTGNSPTVETSVPNTPPSSPVPARPAPYPSVLPNCMKTWIEVTSCKDITDSSCYCLDAGFTKTIQDCVSAWAANNYDVQSALSNLAGICAKHVSQNPGIITNVPKTIILVPTPVSQPPSGASSAPTSPPTLPPVSPPVSSAPITSIPSLPSSPPVGESSVPSTVANSPVGGTIPPPAANPVTTLSLSQPVPYACPVSQLPDGQPQAPASSCTSLLVTQVVVPQVGFETAPAAPGVTSPSVDLVAGSPASVIATATSGPVGNNENSPVGATTFGTVVGSVSAIGSTFSQGGTVPFTGSASSIKVSGLGLLAGVIGMLFLA
ncbi:MAG: hypothetical protein Q9213_006859 [Squamulea squamosa]